METKFKVKAIVIASNEQLDEIGCSRELSNIEVGVSDIDKWSGMYKPCSTVHYNYKVSEDYIFEETYIIPTKWLKFIN